MTHCKATTPTKVSFMFENLTEEPLRIICDGKEVTATGPVRLEGYQVRIQLVGRALPGPPDCTLAEWCNYTFDERDILFMARHESHEHYYPIESSGPRRALTLDEGVETSRDFYFVGRVDKIAGQFITTAIRPRE